VLFSNYSNTYELGWGIYNRTSSPWGED
jgi:hypothetical protein